MTAQTPPRRVTEPPQARPRHREPCDRHGRDPGNRADTSADSRPCEPEACDPYQGCVGDTEIDVRRVSGRRSAGHQDRGVHGHPADRGYGRISLTLRQLVGNYMLEKTDTQLFRQAQLVLNNIDTMRQQNNAEKSSSSLLYSYFVQIRDSDDTILRNAIVPTLKDGVSFDAVAAYERQPRRRAAPAAVHHHASCVERAERGPFHAVHRRIAVARRGAAVDR